MTAARILLVEDEQIVAMEIQDLLQSLGYIVVGMVAAGEQAIQQAAEMLPDLVLMDIRLKGNMDGIDAAEQIRARFDIPVIYLTAYADEPTLERAKVTQPFGYLTKPFDERSLHTAVEIALFKHQMERRLKDSERWLGMTLRSIGDAVIATDHRGRVEFMNSVAEELIGRHQREACGRSSASILALLDEQTRARLENPVSTVLRTSVSVSPAQGAILRARDDSETPIDYSAAPLVDERGQVVGAVLVFRDITERQQAAQQLERRLAQTQTLREVMLAAAATLDFDQVLDRTCRILHAKMQTEFLRFAIADEEDDSLWIHPAHIGYGSGTVQPHVHLGEGLCTKVYQTDETVLIQETQGEPGTTGVQLGTRSALAIPIHVGGRIVGVMNLESRRPHAFGEEELNFYTAIAAQMGIALENARLYQAVSRHAQESEAALVQMQELDRHKNEFMQNVSHELRTPLSLILGYSEWLVDNELGELPIQQREMIKIVHRQTCILRDLVEDIALTWLSEVRPLTHEVVALDELLRSVLNDYRPQARQAGLRLHAHLARHLPPVQGAPEYLRRVLANLMSNALKFTPRGGTVRVDMLGQGEHLVVSVTDTGIGIPPHHHERIFERFTQVDGSIRRKYGGSGLGLALVKQIVEAHKGTVKVESKLGKGSKFTIRLPAAGA